MTHDKLLGKSSWKLGKSIWYPHPSYSVDVAMQGRKKLTYWHDLSGGHILLYLARFHFLPSPAFLPV